MSEGEEHYEEMEGDDEVESARKVYYHCDGELHEGVIFFLEDGETEMIVFELNG